MIFKKLFTPRKVFLISIIILILGIGFKYLYNKNYANIIYKELRNINTKLTQIQVEANLLQLKYRQIINLNQAIKNLKHNHLNKEVLLKAVNEISFDPIIKANMLESVNQLTVYNYREIHYSLAKNFEILHLEVKQDNIQLNGDLKQINQALAIILTQVNQLEVNATYRLELARLKFVTNKLHNTVDEIHKTALNIVLDDLESGITEFKPRVVPFKN